jgi:hypothetical protein
MNCIKRYSTYPAHTQLQSNIARKQSSKQNSLFMDCVIVTLFRKILVIGNVVDEVLVPMALAADLKCLCPIFGDSNCKVNEQSIRSFD